MPFSNPFHARSIPPLHAKVLGLVVMLTGAWANMADALDAPLMTEAARPPAVLGYKVVNAWPHDRGAFTQGLILRDGFFYESTGLNGRSSLRKVNPETGEVLKQPACAFSIRKPTSRRATWKSPTRASRWPISMNSSTCAGGYSPTSGKATASSSSIQTVDASPRNWIWQAC